jgi:hypothetical protein
MTNRQVNLEIIFKILLTLSFQIKKKTTISADNLSKKLQLNLNNFDFFSFYQGQKTSTKK